MIFWLKPKTWRLPRERHQRDLPLLAGLEADGRAGGDVEAHALGLLAVEGEGAVGLVEVIVRADLDRPVAGVGDFDEDGLGAGIQLDLAVGGEDFSGDHCLVSLCRPAADAIVAGREVRARSRLDP